jgi:hypothetical protein
MKLSAQEIAVRLVLVLSIIEASATIGIALAGHWKP